MRRKRRPRRKRFSERIIEGLYFTGLVTWHLFQRARANMKPFTIPGAFWVGLITALIGLLEQYFASMWWTASVVLILGTVAKLLEIWIPQMLRPEYTAYRDMYQSKLARFFFN